MWWWALSTLTVVISLQYKQTRSHSVVHLKGVCYLSIISQKIIKRLYGKPQTLTDGNADWWAIWALQPNLILFALIPNNSTFKSVFYRNSSKKFKNVGTSVLPKEIHSKSRDWVAASVSNKRRARSLDLYVENVRKKKPQTTECAEGLSVSFYILFDLMP